MAPPAKASTEVFVAYSYKLYPSDEYRQLFARVGNETGVKFVYADTRITTDHILDKITRMIREAAFCVFDISDWNPNVTLELGIARASGRPCYILIDPSKSTGGIHEAPADLRGFDRVQYSTFDELESGLLKLLRQRLPTRSESRQESLPEEIIVCNETVEVEATRHAEVHASISKGVRLSVLAREVDGDKFDLYVVDRKNYVKFCRDRSGTDLIAVTDESIVSFEKKIPRDGIWYVVLDAYGKINDREIALDVRLRPQSV